jgi:capsule biosynthesis phosphatase
MEKSTFVMDVDHTICVAPKNGDTGTYDYVNAKPIMPVIEKLRALKDQGHRIVLNTSRGMRTYKGDVKKIAENVLPTLTDWLNKNGVPFDEIHIGKPWGPNVYYIDDKAMSPRQFIDSENFSDVIKKNLIDIE